MFLDLGKPIRDGTNAFIDWLVVTHGDLFEAVNDALLVVLVGLERFLRDAPPWAVLIGVFAIAWLAGRSWRLGIGMTFAAWMIGCLGLWTQAMQTIAILLIAVGLSILIGIPLGVVASRSDRFRALLNPLLDLMQTIPSFVYLIPAAMLFGLGKVPAILATVIYAAPPLIRLTELGIRLVDREVLEAARAFGATRWQLLRTVQIPLALPNIMQGINQTTMMALAMVVVASMIGARGVGETVLLGLQRNDSGQGLLGGLVIVILAILFDRISQALGRRMQKYREYT